jgi:hypothetical protein
MNAKPNGFLVDGAIQGNGANAPRERERAGFSLSCGMDKILIERGGEYNNAQH